MTTASWSTVLDQSTDAGFRAWGSELNAKLAAVGMVQTSDTGQINWTTVVRGVATNTSLGYEIWRLSGSALYFKIEYGTGSTIAVPSMWFTTGTGSNGSGTLTGTISTRTQAGKVTTAPTSTSTNYQSYLCATADYFCLSWKLGSSGTANIPRCVLGAARTVDNTGTASTVGYIAVMSTTFTPLWYQCVATAAGVAQAAASNNNTLFLIPGIGAAISSSSDGAGDVQAFVFWYAVYGSTPIQPLLHLAGALATELAVGLTASMTLVGTSPHTYLSCGNTIVGDAGNNVTPANLVMLMLWE